MASLLWVAQVVVVLLDLEIKYDIVALMTLYYYTPLSLQMIYGNYSSGEIIVIIAHHTDLL